MHVAGWRHYNKQRIISSETIPNGESKMYAMSIVPVFSALFHKILKDYNLNTNSFFQENICI
jgi:hypothetical protein